MKTKKLNVTIQRQRMAIYKSSIDVPINLIFAEAIQYAKEHIKEIPLGKLDYVEDSDMLDIDNCEFEK